MNVARSIPKFARFSLLAIVIGLLAAVLLGREALAAEQWLRRTPGPDPYVRNVTVFSNTPVAGQAVVYANTLTNGVVRIVDNGSTLVPSFRNNGLPILRVRSVAGPDVNNLYVALDGAGVYKTSDGGANWVSANGSGGTALGCLTVRTIAVRTTATEIWAATACRHASGIYRSLDGGGTWARLGSGTIPDDDTGSSFAFFGTGPTTVVAYASLRNGIFRSGDNGATWAQINNGLPVAGGPNQLSAYGVSFFAAASDMIAYVEGAGVYRTINSGANWSSSGTGLPNPLYSFAGVIKQSNTVLFIGTDKGPVFRSGDGGATWSAWGNSGPGTSGYVRGVSQDTTAANRYWLPGISGLYRTNDNGLTFSLVGLGGEGYVSSMVLDPDGLAGYFASDSLYKIPDVYVWDPNNTGVDIGTGLPGTTLGGYVAQDKAQPGTLYASLNYQGLWKTVNGGTSWTQLALPNVLAASPPFVEITPTNTQLIYASPGNPFLTATGGGFFKSTNGGGIWTETSTGLATPEARDVNGIALTEAPSQVIVIGTLDGLYRSADGGANWAPVLQFTDELGAKLPMGSVRFDPVNPLLVYAGAIHVNADGTVRASSGVWKSVNGGVNWAQVLSGKRVTAVRPESSGRVIAMLNRDPSQPAVLATTDGGTTWQPFNTGITYNDGIAISRAVSELGSHVVLASMTDGIYVQEKPLVSVTTVGGGAVGSTPAGFSCRGSCSKRYFYNDSVTLNATPDSGYVFNGWSGACTSTTACVLSIDGAKTVTATFGLDPTGDYDNDGIPNAVELVEGTNPLVKDNDVFGNARLFSMQQYRDFLSREGDPAGIVGWTNLITGGTYSRVQVINSFLLSDEFAGVIAPVVRLYFATFLRIPDYAGLTFNAGLVRNGTVTITQLADFFTASPEFAATYGSLNNTQFVTLLYNNVLGRAPDPAGLNGWVQLLTTGGYSRGQVLLGFSDSVEYQASQGNKVFVTMMYTGMLRRTPEPTGFNGWVGFLDAGTYSREQVINGFFLSTEYHGRFLP
jgi:uncharacterized repeat protein (TIGR02543 family)